MKKRKVYVLLTRFWGLKAKLLGLVSRCNYTHASIGLEEDMNTFYSFVFKGFIVEKIPRYIKPEYEPFPCQLYEIEVSEQAYQRLKRRLHWFESRKPTLRYTKLGVAMCVLQIPFWRKDYYFCSQFVAESLMKSRAARLKKDSCLYLPRDFSKIPGVQLRFQGNLKSLLHHSQGIQCAV